MSTEHIATPEDLEKIARSIEKSCCGRDCDDPECGVFRSERLLNLARQLRIRKRMRPEGQIGDSWDVIAAACWSSLGDDGQDRLNALSNHLYDNIEANEALNEVSKQLEDQPITCSRLLQFYKHASYALRPLLAPPTERTKE